MRAVKYIDTPQFLSVSLRLFDLLVVAGDSAIELRDLRLQAAVEDIQRIPARGNPNELNRTGGVFPEQKDPSPHTQGRDLAELNSDPLGSDAEEILPPHAELGISGLQDYDAQGIRIGHGRPGGTQKA